MRTPKIWLKDGDDMRVYIDGIGSLENLSRIELTG